MRLGESAEFEFEASAALIEHQAELAAEAGLEFDPEAQVRLLAIKDAVCDERSFLETVKVLCRADLVVFDVTGFQPGTMLLLGIRSVVRRGVTICTLDSPHVEAYRAELPYCLQVLNVCSHSVVGPDSSGIAPRDVIARKAIEGFREEQSNPHYLDLPAYDAVRQFGSNTDKYRPIPYEEQVLFLCPFSSEYIKACWDASIARVFRRCLIQRHHKLAKGGSKEGIHPELRRLLDRSSPQIVSQSLYEAVRRSQMCIADSTNLRPNLFFELGVRLAVNRHGAVHIVADGKLKAQGKFRAVETGSSWGAWPCDATMADEVRKSAKLEHVAYLKRVLKPIEYPVASIAEAAYEKMLDRYFQNQSAAPQFDHLVYRTIGETLSRIANTPDVNIARSLIQSASMLGGIDAFNNFSVVLHGDVSPQIRHKCEVEALEHKMAAWLYMHGRYGSRRIVEDVAIYLEYEVLSLDILLDGGSHFPHSLLATVAAGYEQVASQAAAMATYPFALLEQHVGNLLKVSKLLKSKKDYWGAIGKLQSAIDLIDESVGGSGPIAKASRVLSTENSQP